MCSIYLRAVAVGDSVAHNVSGGVIRYIFFCHHMRRRRHYYRCFRSSNALLHDFPVFDSNCSDVVGLVSTKQWYIDLEQHNSGAFEGNESYHNVVEYGGMCSKLRLEGHSVTSNRQIFLRDRLQ